VTGHIAHHILPAALALLPPAMDTPAARALVLAIGLQESRFRARRQLRGGPARGYWQFELAGGVAGVLTHPSSRPHIARVLAQYGYPHGAHACWEAIEHNDVLAAVFARLLLWTLPSGLPAADQVELAWATYLEAWRPGAPHPELWPACYAQAWARVQGAA
jgi:hypothetical protein